MLPVGSVHNFVASVHVLAASVGAGTTYEQKDHNETDMLTLLPVLALAQPLALLYLKQ